MNATSLSVSKATTTTPTAPGSTQTCTWLWRGLASTSPEAKQDQVRRPFCFSQCPPSANLGEKQFSSNDKEEEETREDVTAMKTKCSINIAQTSCDAFPSVLFVLGMFVEHAYTFSSNVLLHFQTEAHIHNQLLPSITRPLLVNQLLHWGIWSQWPGSAPWQHSISFTLQVSLSGIQTCNLIWLLHFVKLCLDVDALESLAKLKNPQKGSNNNWGDTRANKSLWDFDCCIIKASLAKS